MNSKKQLFDNNQNPARQKSKREYTFSTSIILIVIGLGTTGASLFVESLGSYHAACGIILTIFGFFWPNVEVRKEAIQSAGKAPKLAIETQQRSLTHRMSGLATRISSIRNNLESLNSNLESLDQGMNAPYISE
jgi:predicted glycosyltransferase